MRKKYDHTEQEKAQLVQLTVKSDKTIIQIAKENGIPEYLLRRWRSEMKDHIEDYAAHQALDDPSRLHISIAKEQIREILARGETINGYYPKQEC